MLNFHLKITKYLTFVCLISLVISLIIINNYIENFKLYLFPFEIFYFNFINSFTINLLISLIISLIINFPLFCFLFINFFKSGLTFKEYRNLHFFLKQLNLTIFICFIINSNISYFILNYFYSQQIIYDAKYFIFYIIFIIIISILESLFFNYISKNTLRLKSPPIILCFIFINVLIFNDIFISLIILIFSFIILQIISIIKYILIKYKQGL